MVRTSFDQDTGILKSWFEGEVQVEQILEYITATMENTSYPRKLKILTDATDAHMNFSPGDLNRIVEANNQSLQQYDFIHDAIVTGSPRETALSLVYKEMAKSINYKFQIFSTRTKAQQWLIIQ